jgi:hypothetical protein
MPVVGQFLSPSSCITAKKKPPVELSMLNWRLRVMDSTDDRVALLQSANVWSLIGQRRLSSLSTRFSSANAFVGQDTHCDQGSAIHIVPVNEQFDVLVEKPSPGLVRLQLAFDGAQWFCRLECQASADL